MTDNIYTHIPGVKTMLPNKIKDKFASETKLKLRKYTKLATS